MLAVALPGFVHAQERPPSSDSVALLDTAAVPGNTLVPLPAVFYTPETGWGFGGVITYYMYGARQRSDRVLPSTISGIGIYTTKKQIIALVNTELYLGGGDYRLLGGMGYSKFPTKFWGVGNEAPDSLEEDYTPETFSFRGEFQWQALPGWYLGVVAQAAHRELAEIEEDGQLATGLVPGTADGRIVGAGVLISRDTRDNAVFPSRGVYHQLRVEVYDGLFQSNYDFGSYTLDLRAYVSPVERHVLAVRGLGQATSGIAPFDMLPQLGGDVLLRGYYEGRFRDRHLLAAQIEYRAHVWWRIGVVGFVGGGQVAGTLDSFRWGGFKASAGGGLRLLLDPQSGLNIRADYGWAFDTHAGGFYVNVGEAF